MFHRLPVGQVERLCDDAVAVTFDVPDDLAETYRFRAGQYLTLRLGTADGEQRRSYSICAPEGAAPRIGVRRVDTGLFSEWLVERLAVGDELEVGPPQGRFTPDPKAGEHHALIAAGSGITPVLSIAATVLAAHPDNHVTLLYGNRRSDTVMFAEDLADLKDRYGPRLQLDHVLSREPMESEIFSGRLDREKLVVLLSFLVPTPKIDQWWLCGPLGMITDAQEVLGEHGVARERIHCELFYVDAPPPEPTRHEEEADDGDGASATVVLNGRRTTLTLPRSQPVLDSAQEVRSDLPFACKGGVCGTCAGPSRADRGPPRRRRGLPRQARARVPRPLSTARRARRSGGAERERFRPRRGDAAHRGDPQPGTRPLRSAGRGGSIVTTMMFSLCVVATVLVTVVAVVRYHRDDETLRWERIAKRARVREAAARAAARYATLPAVTVMAPLAPVVAPHDRAA